ncbi:hypothetical protein HC928_21795 [bacterium]|nr:hypothetical protein [bacterium]
MPRDPPPEGFVPLQVARAHDMRPMSGRGHDVRDLLGVTMSPQAAKALSPQ